MFRSPKINIVSRRPLAICAFPRHDAEVSSSNLGRSFLSDSTFLLSNAQKCRLPGSLARFERGRSAQDMRGGGRLKQKGKAKKILPRTGREEMTIHACKKGEGAMAEMKRGGAISYRVINSKRDDGRFK